MEDSEQAFGDLPNLNPNVTTGRGGHQSPTHQTTVQDGDSESSQRSQGQFEGPPQTPAQFYPIQPTQLPMHQSPAHQPARTPAPTSEAIFGAPTAPRNPLAGQANTQSHAPFGQYNQPSQSMFGQLNRTGQLGQASQSVLTSQPTIEARLANQEQRIERLEQSSSRVEAKLDGLSQSLKLLGQGFNEQRQLQSTGGTSPAPEDWYTQQVPPVRPVQQNQNPFGVPPPVPPKPAYLQNAPQAYLQPEVKLSDIGLFHPNLKVTSEYPAGDILSSGKEVIYRDVMLFVQQVRRVGRTKPGIAPYIHTCFRGAAMQWFSALTEEIQDWLIADPKKLLDTLTEKYRLSRSLALDKLHREHYTMQNALDMRSADEYVQAIMRYCRSAGINDTDAILAHAWDNLEFELQRDTRAPVTGDSTDDFAKRLQQASELWSKKARQSNQSSQDREEAAFQRGLAKARRDMLVQQNQPQYQPPQQWQGYNQQQGFNQQNQGYRQRQYQPRNEQRFEPRAERNTVLPPPNQPAQASQSRPPYNGQKLLTNTADDGSFEHQHQDPQFQHGYQDQNQPSNQPNYQPAYQPEYEPQTSQYQPDYQSNLTSFQQNYHTYFIDKDLGPIDVFFNDSPANEGKAPPFSCTKCLRRWSNGDQLHEHLLGEHKINSRASPYTNLVHHISVYSPTTRGYIKVIARTPDKQRRDICLDSGSMVSLIDSKLAKAMNLTPHVMKNVNLTGVGNQTTSSYVNYTLKIGDEDVFVQAYVIDDLTAGILLGADVIEDYSIDLVTSKRMVAIGDSQVPMSFGRAGGIVVNHTVISPPALASSPKTPRAEPAKFRAVTSHPSSAPRATLPANRTSGTPQAGKAGKAQKQPQNQPQKDHKCQRCFRTFCSGNELHRHIASTHTMLRRRRSSERNHRPRDLASPWRQL